MNRRERFRNQLSCLCTLWCFINTAGYVSETEGCAALCVPENLHISAFLRAPTQRVNLHFHAACFLWTDKKHNKSEPKFHKHSCLCEQALRNDSTTFISVYKQLILPNGNGNVKDLVASEKLLISLHLLLFSPYLTDPLLIKPRVMKAHVQAWRPLSLLFLLYCMRKN